MTLHLFDTAEQRKRAFHPVVPGHVSMYVCGATVQAPPHIGHMRGGVAFDLLRRWLIANGHTVTFVRNVTDIDDKVLDRAAHTGVPWWAIAATVERDFQDAYRALDCLPPTLEPRATGHIPDMIALTERLLRSGAAYVRSEGVYFSVANAPDYGALSGQDPDHLRNKGSDRTTSDASGAITDVTTGPTPGVQVPQTPRATKNDPRDFALWKGAKPTEPATAAWRTPWGRARPGWHLECSAMSTRYLGPVFDIHGGGRDLVFPHHENERAQSRTAGDEFAQYWVHNAWVTVGGEKMSKSLDNSLSVRELLAEWSARSLRYWLVSGHYRSTLEYSPEALSDATAASIRVETFLANAKDHLASIGEVTPNDHQPAARLDDAPAWNPSPRPASEWADRFAAALNDDLNTPHALAVVHDAVRTGNTAIGNCDNVQVRQALRAVDWMTDILGIAPTPRQPSTNDTTSSGADQLIDLLVDLRGRARRRQDFDEADHIRRALAELDVEVLDTATVSTWRQR